MTPAGHWCHRGARERVPSGIFDTLVDPPAAADRGADRGAVGARSAVAGVFGMAFGRLRLVGGA